jgi:hypothetical protein
MGFISQLARSFGLVLLAAGSAAQADVLHMPFDCRADGAGVHLRRAPERTYAIIGRHEREIFTACSPTEPDTCRNWFVHRFEFDCDGDRVAWIDAAAAAARFTDWDAWIEDGQFRMRMNQLWGVARRWRRHFRDREDAFAGGPDRYARRVVSVRPGFAPAVGIPLTFSGGAQELSELPAQAVQDAPVVAGNAPKPASAPIPELPERAPSKAERLAAASAPPVVAPAPKPATKPTAAQISSMPAPTQQAPTKTKASDSATPANNAQGFTIINAPHPKVDEPKVTAPDAVEAHAGGTSEPIETAAVTAPAEKSMPAAAASPAMPGTDAAPVAPKSKAVPVEASSPPRTELPQVSPEAAAAAAATTLVLAGLAVFGLWRLRRRPFDAPPVNRDIADISLDGGGAAPRLALDSPAMEADAPAPESRDLPSDDEAEGDASPVPTTYAEALDVLGASADASTGAIKKIVEGLRQSWHPDLARSEADRARREARVRQINVAWDLVSQNRSAA